MFCLFGWNSWWDSRFHPDSGQNLSQRSPNGPGKQPKTELFVLVLGVLWGSFPHLEAAFLRMATVPKHSSKRMKLRATKTHIVTSQFVYLHLGLSILSRLDQRFPLRSPTLAWDIFNPGFSWPAPWLPWSYKHSPRPRHSDCLSDAIQLSSFELLKKQNQRAVRLQISGCHNLMP